MKTKIEGSSNMSLANDLIHDCWFSIDEIVFDVVNSTLDIPFEREFFEERRLVSGGILKTVDYPIFRCHLQINNVTSYKIEDTQGIGKYNFSDFDFDEREERINFNTGIPMRFFVDVTKLEIGVWRDEFPLRTDSQKVIFS